MPRPGAPDDWAAARSGLADLEVAPDMRAAADAYFSRWRDYPPDFFVDNGRKRRDLTRRAFDHGEGWGARLLSCLETPAHFSLHARHFDLDRDAAAPHLLFDRANVGRWKRAILHHFRGPCRWRLALGDGGRVHCHVLADLSDGPPELPRNGEVVKPCADYWEAAVTYQLVPPMSWNAEHLALWMTAKRRGRLPTLAGARGVPQKRRWHEASRLRETFSSAPVSTSTPATPAPAAPTPRPHPLSRPLSRLYPPATSTTSRPHSAPL